jgi:hypothetical protein
MAAPLFEQSGKSHKQLISPSRAFYMAQKARGELAKTDQKTAEQIRKALILQLNRLRMALLPKASDPRTVDALIRISRCVAKLYGLDARQRIESSRPDGELIETQEPPPDYSRLTREELLQLAQLLKKAEGLPPGTHGVIDFTPYQPRTYAAKDQDQRAAQGGY